MELFWNLVDRTDAVGKAVDVANEADVVVLAVGASWSSDGESGDRATLGLSVNQSGSNKLRYTSVLILFKPN